MPTKLRKNNGDFIEADNLTFTSSINDVTTLDNQQLIDIKKPLRVSSYEILENDNNNNWKYAELIDLRFKHENTTAFASSVFNIDILSGDSTSYAPRGLVVDFRWLSNSITGQYFTAITGNALVSAISTTGRIHDCAGIQGQVQITNGAYAYSNAEAGKFFIDVRTTGNGKMYGLYVRTYLSGSSSCTEFYGISVYDQGVTGTVSSNRKRGFSIQASDFSERFYIDLDGTTMKMTQSTPSSSSDTGAIGSIKVDDSYIYICTATNTWKRAALTTF